MSIKSFGGGGVLLCPNWTYLNICDRNKILCLKINNPRYPEKKFTVQWIRSEKDVRWIKPHYLINFFIIIMFFFSMLMFVHVKNYTEYSQTMVKSFKDIFRLSFFSSFSNQFKLTSSVDFCQVLFVVYKNKIKINWSKLIVIWKYQFSNGGENSYIRRWKNYWRV